MQPRNEKFFTLFSKAGSNVVESAAILMEFVAAPPERWAKMFQEGVTPNLAELLIDLEEEPALRGAVVGELRRLTRGAE